LALIFTASAAFGQMRSSGMSAFSGGGMGGMGSSGFGGGGFGGSGMGGSGGFGGGGMSGFGGGGFGNSGMGRSGFGNSGFGNSGFGNSGFGNSGFGGAGSGQYGGGQSFVGRDAADMQGTFQQTSRAQTQFFNNMNRQMARNNRRENKATSAQNPPQPMRMEVRAAFAVTKPTPGVVGDKLRTRLAKILTEHHMTQPLLTMQGDTAVISGQAASDSERQVIAQLVALEAGVRDVRNEMTVAGETIAPSELPPGS